MKRNQPRLWTPEWNGAATWLKKTLGTTHTNTSTKPYCKRETLQLNPPLVNLPNSPSLFYASFSYLGMNYAMISTEVVCRQSHPNLLLLHFKGSFWSHQFKNFGAIKETLNTYQGKQWSNCFHLSDNSKNQNKIKLVKYRVGQENRIWVAKIQIREWAPKLEVETEAGKKKPESKIRRIHSISFFFYDSACSGVWASLRAPQLILEDQSHRPLAGSPIKARENLNLGMD